MEDQKEKKQDEELLDGINYTGEKGPCFGTRHTQVILMALGIGLATATKVSFSIILIAMTTADTSPNQDIPVYDWGNKGVIIGAILWSGIPIQIVAGYLGKLWGPKWLTLGASIINAVFFMLIPAFAGFGGSVGVIVCRVVQGAAQGGLVPLSAVVNGIWVPAEERSKAGLIGAVGSIGVIMISSVLSGVIAASTIGWPWCFYIMGIAQLVWSVLWFFLAHQNPQSHPRITPEEQKYIEVSLSQHKSQEIPTPWKKIITSIYFWAIIVAALGTDWTATMLSTEIPIFLSKILEMDVQSSGTIMAIAPVVGITAGIILAPLSDFLIKRKILSCVNARRLFHTVGTIGNAINLIWMTFLKPGQIGLVILNLCVSNIFILTYNVGGAGVNALDISPVFAGIITGVASTFSQAFALFAPLSVDWIVHDETSAVQWRTIFIITGAITLVSTTFYDIFTTDKRQEHWEAVSAQDKEKKLDS